VHPNRAWRLGVVISVLLAWFYVVRAQSSAVEHASSHIIVKFKPEIRRNASRTPGHAHSNLLERLKLPKGAVLEEPAITAELGESDDRFLYLRLPPGLAAKDCAKLLEKHPDLEFAEEDGIGTGGTIMPNDPGFLVQWHHRNSMKLSASIRTPNAWDITCGSNSVIVAVLDTGVNTALAEFEGRTLSGYNFVSGNVNALDDHGHGTAVAGVICASGNNDSLVAGIDWHCRLLPVKVLDSANTGQLSWWAQGIDYAVSRGAKVINLSAGSSTTSSAVTRAITNAIAKGVIFVTITHNHGSGTITFPGNFAESITVGATDRLDQRATFSNYGSQIDLVAPGTNIATVGRSGAVEYWTGTSFAAPQVSGVCALLASVKPKLDQRLAKILLCSGAEDRVGNATDVAGFDNYHGWGRLNAYNSLLLAQTTIDRVAFTNNSLVLSWPSPSNASNRQPYLLEYQVCGLASWFPGPTNSFTYTPTRTWWTNINPRAKGAVYRLRVKETL
jgi:subtilisin family serine protease